MEEYSEHLDFYAQNYKWSDFSRLVPFAKWGKIEVASEYMKKFWLTEVEYQKTWKPKQDRIFINQHKGLPELVFPPEYEIFPMIGGCTFAQKNFEELQKAMLEVGETHFVIIEGNHFYTEGEPTFRMKFPCNIKWTELTSGNYISAVLLEMNFNDYFVFGETAQWGKYVATDYKTSLYIIGFKPEYSGLFRRYLTQTEEQQKSVQRNLPPNYKEIIKLYEM